MPRREVQISAGVTVSRQHTGSTQSLAITSEVELTKYYMHGPTLKQRQYQVRCLSMKFIRIVHWKYEQIADLCVDLKSQQDQVLKLLDNYQS